jgi:hypothetical protein
VARFNEDLEKVERFFLDVLEGRLETEEQINKVAFSFFGIQGPWYTVGWKMAVTIEEELGRSRLLAVVCDSAGLLATYNEAAARHNRSTDQPLALWTPSLIDVITVTH